MMPASEPSIGIAEQLKSAANDITDTDGGEV